MKTITVCAILFVSFTSCAKLPPSFQRCSRQQEDFETCLAAAVEDAMGQMTRPIRELGLPSLDPLEVESLQINAGTKAVGLHQNFTDVKIYGINKNKCPKMDIDFRNKTMDNLCIYPEIRMETNYKIAGKILILDIHGSGPGTITLENVSIPVHYKFDEYQKNGETYLKITDIDLKLKPGKVHFEFRNLFGGDKLLSDNVHQVINENWKEVYEDVSSSYDEIFGRITKKIYNALLERVPVSELFSG